MPRAKRKKGIPKGLAIPGIYISTIEEFSAKRGSYEEGGGVYASRIGRLQYDLAQHYVSVEPLKRLAPESLAIGSELFGTVEDVKKNFAQVAVFGKDALGRLVPFSALLHVSHGGVRRARTVVELVKPGDVVRVRVITNWVPVQVSMEGQSLGVVAAKCSQCGGELRRERDGLMKCERCGHRELRKVSDLYGKPLSELIRGN